jgi:class 3 adenylate cyclase
VGDALTAWFEADAGQRAVACGLAMQQAMTHFAQVTVTDETTIALAIKVGIATGPIRRFRVGDPHLQYLDVLAGKTLEHMAGAEKLAQPGEVVVAPQLIASLGPQLEVINRRRQPESDQDFGVVTRLTHPVAESPWPPSPPLTETQVRPWLLQPVYERLQAAQGRFLAEARQAVALFLKFEGWDYDHDETVAAKFDAFIRLVQNIINSYEGYLIQLTIGDKGSFLYAAFGAPRTHDDAPAQAMAAALELQALTTDLAAIDPILDITTLQIGISQGRMLAGAYGSELRRTYGVIGQETIIAARLMALAEPGQIMVSRRIVNATSKRYRFRELEPVFIKGKEKPLPVALVVDKLQPASPVAATIFIDPVVGRDE